MLLAQDSATDAAQLAAKAATVGAVIAGIAVLVTVVLGIMNLRQARRGPDRYPSWTVERPHPNRHPYLVNTGTADARDVRVEFTDIDSTEGDTAWPVFQPGIRRELQVFYTEDTVRPQITVHFRGQRNRRHTWGPYDLLP